MAYQLAPAKVWSGTEWVDAVGGLAYADITATPTGTFTDGGIDYKYYRYTSSSSLTIDSDGFIDVLVVGGGGGGVDDQEQPPGRVGGGAGAVRFGTFEVTAGSYTITIGAGGAGFTTTAGNEGGNPGNASSFGSILKSGGGGAGFVGSNRFGFGTQTGFGGGGSPGGVESYVGSYGGPLNTNGGGAGGTVYGSNQHDGINLNYTGSTVEYGKGGTTTTPTANTGTGGIPNAGNGADGVVVVKVRI